MHKYVNSANNGAKEMEFGLLDSGEDGEHSGVGLVEKSRIFAMQNDFFRGQF